MRNIYLAGIIFMIEIQVLTPVIFLLVIINIGTINRWVRAQIQLKLEKYQTTLNPPRPPTLADRPVQAPPPRNVYEMSMKP